MEQIPRPSDLPVDEPNLTCPESIFDLLNFRISELLGISGSLVTRLCEGEFGVTREEWQFVAMLAGLGTLSPAELAARTTVDRSQCSRALRRLQAKQLIHRERVPGDARRARIGLTEGGQALYARVFPRVVQVHAAMLSGLDEAEIEALARCLRKLHEAAETASRSGLVAGPADRRSGGSRSIWQAKAAAQARA
jgi:DNA-binding MarR family transcriptional regulator